LPGLQVPIDKNWLIPQEIVKPQCDFRKAADLRPVHGTGGADRIEVKGALGQGHHWLSANGGGNYAQVGLALFAEQGSIFVLELAEWTLNYVGLAPINLPFSLGLVDLLPGSLG
jgi:hypothetical protein